ncbi:MAG: biopolymer transporter ExbD [Gammaproteobacteria bacterium]|nr:biopolymer transporter ExbD [Gammaproteobacteria bacterium]
MRRKHKNSDEEADINMTPMLDIVFIMLIFFIVTTSFVKEAGINVNRPTDAPPQTKEENDVVLIEITDTGQIRMGGRTVDIGAVQANVERARAEKPDATVVVAAGKDSNAGILVRVIDQARQAGALNVSIASDAT